MTDNLEIIQSGSKIRFNDIYSTPEWRDLEVIDRAQLILVAEGVKPGAIIGGNQTSFFEILKNLGLEYSFNTDRRVLDPVFCVGKKIAWKLLSRLINFARRV